MENEKIFDLMTKMYSEMQNGFKEVKAEISENRKEITENRKEITNNSKEIKDLKRVVIHIEQDHGQKLQALFDGYMQNSQQLDRIEKEVSKHEEIILRRIK